MQSRHVPLTREYCGIRSVRTRELERQATQASSGMSDLPEQRLCPVCGAPVEPYLHGSRDSSTGEEFEIRRCVSCKLGVTWPRPASLDPYYVDYHGDRHGTTTSYCANRRLSILRKACGPGNGRKLLDVGCGEGTFLIGARNRGWDVFGTEISPESARRAGLRVFESLQECQTTAPFECITLWHSLEHLVDPVQTLLDAHRLLRPGGVLIIAVPDAGGLQARLFGHHWFHLDTPRHLYHFAPASIRRLMQRTGFVSVGEWHQEFEYDLMGWSQSGLNALSLPQNLFFYTLLKRPTAASRPMQIFTFLLGAILCGLALPLVPIGTMLSRGGTLVVAGRASEFGGYE